VQSREGRDADRELAIAICVVSILSLIALFWPVFLRRMFLYRGGARSMSCSRGREAGPDALPASVVEVPAAPRDGLHRGSQAVDRRASRVVAEAVVRDIDGDFAYFQNTGTAGTSSPKFLRSLPPNTTSTPPALNLQ
jgi:hypothetical protein